MPTYREQAVGDQEVGGVDGAALGDACRGQWDAFYIVHNRLEGRVKFGITSGDPRPRLSVHRAACYLERVLLLEGLPGNVASEIEAATRVTLKLAGFTPVHGREYYDTAALAVVLDVATNYPAREMTGRQAVALPVSVAHAAARPRKRRSGAELSPPEGMVPLFEMD